MTHQHADRGSYEAYLYYLATKRHFSTDSYDFHKYNGKVNASFDKFVTRRDIYSFRKLSKIDNYKQLVIANLVYTDPNIWVGNLVTDAAYQTYLRWLAVNEALEYRFVCDLAVLDPQLRQNLLVTADRQIPLLLSDALSNKITIESATIVAELTNVVPYWQQKIVDVYSTSSIIRLIRKYRPFLQYDRKKFGSLIKQHLAIDK